MKKAVKIIMMILFLVLLGGISFFATYKIKVGMKLKEEPKEVVLKIYYAQDVNKAPVSLTYYTKKMDNKLSQEEQAKQLLNALLRGHDNGYSPMPVFAKVNNVTYAEKVLTVDFNDEFEAMQPQEEKLVKVGLDCIVNTLTQIKKVDSVKIKIGGKEQEKLANSADIKTPLISNIKTYEIEEVDETKIPKYITSMLYTDRENSISFTSKPTTWGAKTMTVKEVNQTAEEEKVIYSVVSNSKDRTITMPKKYEQEWKAKADGLYINDVKVLDKSLYVGNKWTVENYIPLLNADKKITTYPAELEVKDVTYVKDGEKLIKEYKVVATISNMKTKNKAKYTETIYFREGVGIYKKELTNPTSTSYVKLEYEIKK